MSVLIGGAWIYANGSMHIGHLAGLLPGDVIARYYRLKGEKVCYVSGSDCYGTPITLRAKKENRTPGEISDYYHSEFLRDFDYLGFEYDYYGKTSSVEHQEYVKKFHEKLYNSKYIVEREEEVGYCDTCNQYLPDRLIVGICPDCGEIAKGEQCENCGTVSDAKELIDPYCSDCHSQPRFVKTKHLYIELTKLRDELTELLNNPANNWRKNAITFTKKYLDEGLRDRAITRDLSWGVPVPKEGYEDKRIYIWAENVLGYLSSTLEYCKQNKVGFTTFWNEVSKHYYIHGKDNIPFHTIILPALLIACDEGYTLPHSIISSEYITLDGRKISTSENHAIWIKDLVGHYNPDAIRYFFIANGPEKRDSDFSWNEFYTVNNGELLGAYGNFVNRTLVFIKKGFESKVPRGETSPEFLEALKSLYKTIGTLIEAGELKKALSHIFEYIRKANKYFDIEKPWITAKENPLACEQTLFTCVQIIANISVLLEPFLPFSSKKVIDWFAIQRSWEPQEVPSGYLMPEIEILFERLDAGKLQ